MAVEKQRHVIDEQGHPVAVILDIQEYRRPLDALEELGSIRAYDEANASGDKALPFQEAVTEIEHHRRS